MKKILIYLPALFLMSCGNGSTDDTSEDSEVAENSIAVFSTDAQGNNGKLVEKITGADADAYLGDINEYVDITVNLGEGVDIPADKVFDCLKNTTFTQEAYSPYDSQDCLEEASGVALKPSSFKNKGSTGGEVQYIYKLTFLKKD